jgi:esterase/lipase
MDAGFRRHDEGLPLESLNLGEKVSEQLKSFSLPVLVIQGSDDPLVHPEGSKNLYQELGSKDKEFAVYRADRHVIIRGEGTKEIFSRVLSFIQSRL